jgi:hypothetical protein
MTGTFHPGDILVVRKTRYRDVSVGDVVAFRTSKNPVGGLIVHRVVNCTADGLLTQGDACTTPDASHVQACNLIGRVTQVLHGGKSYRVWGGRAGQLWARYVRLRRRLLTIGRAPYRWLRASGIIRRLWHPPLVCVMLTTMRGPVIKYLCGGKTVAIWATEGQTYWCRKPYDLVLDAPRPTTNEQRINE